jgi:REP element-mobilizing transposase RayT
MLARMPRVGKQWQHVVINARCSWLHGDQRGFRSRRHRIHSSGDYKDPPPDGEHEGLWAFHVGRSGKGIHFILEARITIIAMFVLKMRSLGYRIIACSVGKEHLHCLVELSRSYKESRRAVGKCKQRASHAVRKLLPGNIWSEGGQFKKIKDLGHFHNSYGYIREKQEAGTVVWSHRDDENWIDDPALGAIVMGTARASVNNHCSTRYR